MQSGSSGIATLGGSTADASAFTGNIILNKAVTLTAANGGSVDFNTGTWTTNNNIINVTGAGSSVVTLSSTLSTTAAVNVNSGAFQVNGTINGGSSALTVSSGAKLAGTGTINKAVTLSTGSTISPNSDTAIGKLTSTSQTWNGGSTYIWNISDANGAAGTGYDSVALTGALTLNANSGNKMTIKIVSTGAVLNWPPALNTGWTLISSTTNNMPVLAGNFLLDVSDFVDDNGGDVSLFQIQNDPFDAKKLRRSLRTRDPARTPDRRHDRLRPGP